MAKAIDKQKLEEHIDILEVIYTRSLMGSLPLVYLRHDKKGHNPVPRHCDVLDFVQRIGGYGLNMIVSIDETKITEKYHCLQFRGNVEIQQSLFDPKIKGPEFDQFMDISRDRLRAAKSVDSVSRRHGRYGEHSLFAAFDPNEEIEWKDTTQTIKSFFKNLDRRISDIIVYELPFTRIERRNCGVPYLVFVDTGNVRNEENEQKRHLFGASTLYRALAEINSSFWMKTRLEDMPLRERVLAFKEAETCDSYIRAVKKLVAMQLFDDFGKMVSTLAEIQYFYFGNEKQQNTPHDMLIWEKLNPNEDFMNFNNRFDVYINYKIKDHYLAEFKFTSESNHLFDSDGKNLFNTRTLHQTKFEELKAIVTESVKIVDDLKKEVEKCSTFEELKKKIDKNQTLTDELKTAIANPMTEVEQREEMIRLMWRTSYFHSEVLVLSDYYHGVTDSGGIKTDTVDERIDYLMSETMKLLDIVPEVVWKASNELSTEKNGELGLDSPVLVLFLLTKYVEWKKSKANANNTLLGGDPKTANCEKLMLLKHLLHVIQYVLRVRDERDAGALRSVIWLISEFGHTALGINRHIDIENNLFLLAQQQAALFGLKDHYRDHLNHVIQVCLTGWLLLETKFGPQQLHESFHPLKVKGIDPNSPTADKNDPEWLNNILAKWFVASLLHDVGYITSVGDGWMKMLGSFDTKSLISLQKEMQESLKYSINRHLHKDSRDFLPQNPDYADHGVVSALHISERILEVDSKKYDEYFSSLHAVAFHNKSEEDIVFDVDPLTVLLVLCDEIQEWGRPSVDRNSLSLNLAINSQHENECWHDSIESLSVNIKTDYTHGKLSLSLMKNDPLCCTIKYKNTIHQNNSIFQVWLARSESLQRLNLDTSLLMGFSFKLESKIREIHTVHNFRKNETQMERLKRFIREKHYWKLFRWLQCVGYDHDKDHNQEIVTLKIDDLHKSHPVEGGMDEFWKEFSAWKDNGQSF